jgi:hypothetical protein
MTEAAAMQCPLCRVPLVMSERQGVEIDYCPQCRGVWLDRGELDKIIERSARESAAPQPPASPQPSPPSQPGFGAHPGYGHDPRHGHYKGHKRRKSWLEEIFD